MRSIVMILALAACGGAEKPAATPDAQPKVAGPEEACIRKANPDANVPDDAPRLVSVKHIVVKHIDIPTAPDTVTRTRGEACLRALEALDKLKAGAEFATVVGEFSDESGAATREGSLGEIKVEDVAPSFAAAAFGLESGQVSYVVESKFGFHIIVRTD